MKKTLIVTDVTRMRSPRVCIGCVDEQGKNIRPVLNFGNLEEEWLYENGKVVIRPFVKVILDLIRSKPQPPHTEDWIFNPNVRFFREELNELSKLRLLREIIDPDVVSIFGAKIQQGPGYFIRENEGNRSLGTVRAEQINHVRYEQFDGVWRFHLGFTDEGGDYYLLSITDLAFHLYLDELKLKRGYSNNYIGDAIVECFQQKTVFLRIGLARPTWQKFPHCCFLQINGVYSFPDYLEGRCFADFRIKN